MTTVEQALSESRKAMTVFELQKATDMGPSEISDQLRSIGDAGNLEYIPARGHHATSYALKNSGAMPASQAQVDQNSVSAESASSAEVRAVAIENPEPDAGTPPSHAEGSGGDVDLLASANRSLTEQVKLLDALLAAAIEGKDVDCETSGSPSGYIVLAAKRRPIRFTKQENARAAALSAIRSGAQRADVFALVRIGVARKGAEWCEG